MPSFQIRTEIGEGPDRTVDRHFENEWTRVLQVTLRNGAVLDRHAAKEPVTIHCVAGSGTLVAGEERIPLGPGTVVPLQPDVVHAVEASPAVSVLVTRFLPPA